MLSINNQGKLVCKQGEKIEFNFGMNSVKNSRKKLGSCNQIELREIELVFHVTAKRCDGNVNCRTLFIQRWIEERFAENKCFCHFSAGAAELAESDIIEEDKNNRSIIRQIVYTVPYKVVCDSPQRHVKACNHKLPA